MRRTYGIFGTLLASSLVIGGYAGTPAQAAPATTTQLSVSASDDAYTSSARKGLITGSETKLTAGAAAGDRTVSFLKFTTTKAATRATLKLALENVAAGTTLTVAGVPTNWAESTLTAANAPKSGAVTVSAKLAAGQKEVVLDLGAQVKAAGKYAFAVTSSSTTAATRIVSSEHGTAALRPVLQLTVPGTATPATGCKTGAKLVPTCGVLWGAAAGGFTTTPRDTALKQWEATTGRTAAIYHTYHKGNEKFPTKAEIAMTKDAAHPRTLLLNWKVAHGTTWAAVAAGKQDARIDNWSAYVKANFSDQFFLALHHEPENDVNEKAGSGMQAKDYAAMYRHVIQRLRKNGVTNAVNVIAYMGNETFLAKSWFPDLYPGDDVIDWIGLDSYLNADKGYHHGDFDDLLDRGPVRGTNLGFYDWATTKHPGKPVMVAEWGVYQSLTRTADKGAVFDTVLAQLKARPAVKALVYFDTPADDAGDRNISVSSSASALAAFKKIAADPYFNVSLR
ncbi:DNRLRE domain-containing protein [Catenuloplanes sp. NPDC051500]|uniref:DNRLRE domain-containing protein n=1 Tax=Catenuloplanes sp. NPDC051500 TaxID=3363959 RepID=UPI003793B3CE